MKKFLRILYYIIQFTWGLPQNLAGLAMLFKYRKCPKEWYHGALIIYHYEAWGGISLGMFIIMNGTKPADWKADTRIHEYGHTIQSLLLGPLYLLIIGIPSFIWCNTKRFIRLRKEQNVSYFSFYPERWANHLGQHVTREKIVSRN